MRSKVRSLLFVALLVLPAIPVFAQKQLDSQPVPLSPAEAAAQGRALVEQILSQRPEKNFTNTGALRIRRNDSRTEIPLTFQVLVTPTNWQTIYKVTENESAHSTSTTFVRIKHPLDSLKTEQSVVTNSHFDAEKTASTNAFAGSDFWICDLGLEFFHWPGQKILKTELRKTRECKVLESTNPNPAPGAYSRVVSWIDVETDGIIHAEAYDTKNNLLKEFDTKKFKKIKGEWQLEEMQIENVQTGSRSQIEFDLGNKL